MQDKTIMRIHIHTLGCKVNQFESAALETMLSERGHQITAEETGLDAAVINTCAVTAEAGRKSRQAARHLKELNPDALIALCGCWSQADAGAAAALGDVVFGSGDKAGFVEALERAFSEKKSFSSVDNALERRDFELLPAGSPEGRTRALLKIEDGCVNFCSYCIIPYTRGRVRSLPLEACAVEAEKLARQGYREIVLTGIEIASYGAELPEKPTLTDAVEAAAKAAPSCRIRLGSLEPRVVTEDFCRRLSALPNLCPHFHLSLQSGCDRTLSGMRRKYDTARFYASVALLRSCFDNCGLTADLITGFPGETEADHRETMAFIEKCAFSSMHVFPYSVRPGTAAARMEQLPRAVKEARAREAAAAARRMKERFLEAQIGKTLSVLFETEEEGVWTGHAGNYCEVRARGGALRNTVANVQITGVSNGALWGNVLL